MAEPRKEKEAKSLLQRQQILQLIIAGMSYREVADALSTADKSISRSVVSRQYNRVKAQIMERLAEDALEHVAVQKAQIDTMIRKQWPRMTGNDPALSKKDKDNHDLFSERDKIEVSFAATHTIIRLLERQAKLLGLDAQSYLRVTDDDDNELLAKTSVEGAQQSGSRSGTQG